MKCASIRENKIGSAIYGWQIFFVKDFDKFLPFSTRLCYNSDITIREVGTVDHKCQKKALKTGNGWRITLSVMLVTCLLLVCAAVGVLGYAYHYGLRMQLSGDRWLYQEYNEPFIDPGVDCAFSGILSEYPVTDVTVEGTVNTKKLGAYELTYLAEYTLDFHLFTLTCHATSTRTVLVRDTKAPQIQLLTDPDYYTLPGGTYVEEGYVAVDNHDGNITASVVRTENGDQVTYRVTDASGNTAEAVRQIEYSDPVAPELALLGAPHIMLQVETPYEEPGFVAMDNCDGDITGLVEISGEVDTTREGTYVLEYIATDSYGNQTTANRTVYVSKMPPVPGVPHTQYETPLPGTGKVIYLTFDDGPSEHTSRLLDILDKYDIKATFFVVYAGNQAVLQRMVQSGHTVAIHSATHNYEQIYSSTSAYWNDLYITQENIRLATGITTKIVRFPGGSSNTISRNYSPGIMSELTLELKYQGFRYFDWHVDSKDAAGATTADEIYYYAVSGIVKRNSTVLLQHDTTARSVDAAEMIIQWGIANGYTFKALTMDSPACEHTVRN